MVPDALKVSTVATTAVPAVCAPFSQHVIVGIAVGKAVRHNEVEDIGRRKALSAGGGIARPQFEGLFSLLLSLLENKLQRPGTGIRRNFQIHEEVIRVLHGGHLFQAHACVGLHAELRLGDTRAVKHHLNVLVFHAGIPERRIHPLYTSRPDGNHPEKQQDQDRETKFHTKTVIML